MKKWMATMGLSASLFAAASTAGERLSIDSFGTPDNKTEIGGWWYVFNDARVGGNSTVSPAPDHFAPEKSADGQGFAVHLQGRTGNKLGWDFFGVGFTVTADSGCPVCTPIDLSRYSTLEFKIKGKVSAGRLSVNLPYTGNRCENNVPDTLTAWADYQAGITAKVSETWTTVRLDLHKDFSQPGWTRPEHVVTVDQVLRRAHVIQWQFISADGDTADIWIDDIVLY